MKSNYKILKDYIQEVKVRNSDLSAKNLLGINIDKFFMPSVANIVGTDLSVYRIVQKNQFACNRMHVGRDYRIPISLSRRDESFMVSPAYDVFEIKDTKVLDPEYLMMWFSRAEYDRNAWYYTDADVRGGLPWKAFADMKFPLLTMPEQRALVAEYKIIQDRLNLNHQLIKKLEQSAQAIYKEWFISNIDIENLPNGWRIGTLFDLIELQRGFDLPSQNRKDGTYPIYASTGTSEKHNEYKVKAPGIVTGRSGSLGEVFYVDEDFWPLNTTLWVKHFKAATPIFSFYVLKGINIIDYNVGSAVPTLNRNDIHRHQVIIPKRDLIEKFEEIQKVFFNNIKTINQGTLKLAELKSLLLAKMASF